MLCYVSHRQLATTARSYRADTRSSLMLWMRNRDDPITQTFARTPTAAIAAYNGHARANAVASTIQLERAP